MKINKIYNENCIDTLPKISDAFVDLIVTDPFYGSSGRDGSVHLEKDTVIGNRMSSDSFIWFVRQYSGQLYRVTKSNAHCYVFSDWRKYKDVQIAFETNFWELRQLIVWNKRNGMGEYWRSCHEFILFFTKRHPKKLTHGSCFNVINDINPLRGNNKNHDYEKPVELMSKFIIASSNENDLVYDPFIGSGTTAVSCINTKRNFVGSEISLENCNVAQKRIDAEKNKINLI